MHAVLGWLPQELGRYVDGHPTLRSHERGAAAFAEREGLEPSVELEAIHSQAALYLETAGDHLAGIHRALSGEVLAFAPWASARAAAEVCARGAWLLASDLSAVDRIGRSLAIRYSGVLQQERFARSINDADAIEHGGRRRTELISRGALYGVHPRRDRNDHIIGLGPHLPSYTELVTSLAGEEGAYALLSGMAHGEHWATIQVFKRAADGTAQKTMSIDMALFLILNPTKWFTQVALAFSEVFSGPREPLNEILVRVYQALEPIRQEFNQTGA